MSHEKENTNGQDRPLILVAIADEEIWERIKAPLMEKFNVRREVDGLRAIDVLMLLRPVAVIAETGLPGLSGTLLCSVIRNNRYLTRLPVTLILSRKYLIEDFWAKESGAVAAVTKGDEIDAVRSIEFTLQKVNPITENEWNSAEKAILEAGGPAAGVASELEKQLIGATIISRLGEIDLDVADAGGDHHSTIPHFIQHSMAALATVLEFAQVGITLFEPNTIYIVENDAYRGLLNEESFLRESNASSNIYQLRRTSDEMPEVLKLDPVNLEHHGNPDRASTFFALPLSGRKGNYGLLSIMTYKEIAVREYYLHTLSLIGNQLSVALERAMFYEEVRRLSVTDSLTGLANRRALIGRLDDEFRRSIRYGTPLSMAVCDLDDFKLVNDTYGHQVGDIVLREVSNILMDSVREVDLAGRWGGEEIALLFPQTDMTGAMVACERIREQVESHVVSHHGEEIRITLSIGVATIDLGEVCPRSSDVMLNLADKAMYLAKARGKNRVVSVLELDDHTVVPSSEK